MILKQIRLPYTVRQLFAATVFVALTVKLCMLLHEEMILKKKRYTAIADQYYSKTMNGRLRELGSLIILRNKEQRVRDEWNQKMGRNYDYAAKYPWLMISETHPEPK